MAGSTAAPTPELIPLDLERTPAAPPRRPRVLLIGTGFAAAASAAAVFAVLAAYLSVRSQVIADGTSWLPEGATIPLSPGNVSMATLGMSLVLVQWVVHAGRQRDRQHAYFALGLTLLFGVAHIGQMGYLFTEWNLPLNGEVTAQAVLLYTLLGLHLAMVIGALVFLALMGVRSLGGQFTGPDAEGLSAAALYWYVTVAVYSVLWIAVLITK